MHSTSPNFSFESSGLELTFRQACTAEKTGEVEFLDVNHCVTIEDDFGFVTKDFVKPTGEGGQFINGNSHHPQTTFMSILFGEAIRLRRLNQRKDDYLSSLNRLKEKAIRSKFPLNMTWYPWHLIGKIDYGPQNTTRKKTHRFGLPLFPICLL